MGPGPIPKKGCESPGNQIYVLAWLPDDEPLKSHDFLILTVSASTGYQPLSVSVSYIEKTY